MCYYPAVSCMVNNLTTLECGYHQSMILWPTFMRGLYLVHYCATYIDLHRLAAVKTAIHGISLSKQTSTPWTLVLHNIMNGIDTGFVENTCNMYDARCSRVVTVCDIVRTEGVCLLSVLCVYIISGTVDVISFITLSIIFTTTR